MSILATPFVIAITGAAGALGQAVVRHFLVAGHRLVLLDRDVNHLQTVFGVEPDALMLQADVTSAPSIAAAIAQAEQAYGRVDAVVHVAGGFEMGEGVHQITRESWDRMMNLNAWSFVNVAQAVVPLMKRQGGGHIVAVSANAAREGQALKGAYCAAKSALQRLVESLSHELRADGIHVNSVAPTTMDTPANRASMPDADRSAWVTVEAAAQAIAFLATPAGVAVHGQHIQLGGN
ncbi:MAG: SDR family oxidoreductase [Cytophagales bacterium]|nr:SDR family oxidoreductase [Rhizobacter sp.]